MEEETGPIGRQEADRRFTPVEEIFNEKSTRAQEKVVRYKDMIQQYGQAVIFSAIEYVRPLTQPVYDSFCYMWSNFPPFRWFIYTLLIFNSIPVTIFIGWAVLCFAGIVALAGVGITIAEGFFIFLGTSIFLPVAIFLCIAAFAIVTITTFAWFGVKSSVTIYDYIHKFSNGFDGGRVIPNRR